MKRLIVVSSLLLLISCTESKQESIQNFIPGTYVRSFQDEFSKGNDTLIIGIRDPRLSLYRIEKRMGYVQQIDGKMLTPQHSVEQWTAVYNREHGQLHEQRKGKVLSFYPDENKLSLGSSEYQKLSQ